MFLESLESLPRLAPHTLVIRVSQNAIGLKDSLPLPTTAMITKISDAPSELPNSNVMQALKSLGVLFRITRTYNIGGEEIEKIAQLPGTAAVAAALGSTANKEDPLGLARTFTIHFDHNKDVFKDQRTAERRIIEFARRILKETDNVERSHPVACRYLAYTPTDPLYHKQWHHKVMSCEDAWNITLGDPGVVVAVVDTGIDSDHKDLAGNLVAGINTTEKPEILDIPLDYQLDDPDAGKVNNTDDRDGHGTHVAGIISAIEGNNEGVVGVAPRCKLKPVKCFVRLRAPGGNHIHWTNSNMVANGIVAAALDSDVRIINVSIQALDGDLTEYNALIEAGLKEKLVCIAMGNQSSYKLSYPASHKINRPQLMRHVLNVSATSQEDFLAAFSNFGVGIDLSAPGVDIFSTLLDDQYDVESGTSMAAPMVSGIAALLFSRIPDLKPRHAASVICETAEDVGYGEFNPYFGHGRVSASAALRW